MVQEQISSAGSGLMEVRVRLLRMKPDSFTPVSQVPVKRGRKSSGSVKSQEAEKRKMSSPQSTPSKAKKMIQENFLNVSTASKPKIFSNLSNKERLERQSCKKFDPGKMGYDEGSDDDFIGMPRTKDRQHQVPDENPEDKASRMLDLFNSQSKENLTSEGSRSRIIRAAAKTE